MINIKAGRPKTHGHTTSNSPEYSCWNHIKQRCYNPNCSSYYLYGAKGITMDESWYSSFEKFLEDVGYRPDKNYCLDRKDPKGNYTKKNCRWITKRFNAQRVHVKI